MESSEKKSERDGKRIYYRPREPWLHVESHGVAWGMG